MKISPGQLVPPSTPKLADPQAERVRLELVAKIVELQNLVRQLAALVP